MKKMSKRNVGGFTLIELLVVVLIIGILSAVALPQYQKTVLKSRTAEAWSNLSAIRTAVNAYCLENPSSGSLSFSSMKDALPIEVSDSKYFSYAGHVDCASNKKDFYASYLGSGESFDLGFNRAGERRICYGSSCSKIGLSTPYSGADYSSGYYTDSM